MPGRVPPTSEDTSSAVAAALLRARHLVAAGIPPDAAVEGFAADSLFRDVYGDRDGVSNPVALSSVAWEDPHHPA